MRVSTDSESAFVCFRLFKEQCGALCIVSHLNFTLNAGHSVVKFVNVHKLANTI